MAKTPLLLTVMVAIVTLIIFNQGFKKARYQDSCEISSYEYAKLQDAIDLNPEIATAARRELTQEHVSIAKYNRIMREVDRVKLKRSRQVAAIR